MTHSSTAQADILPGPVEKRFLKVRDSQVSTGNASALRIVVAGGGTGGHLYPGIAIAEAFQHKLVGCGVRFLGASAGIEAQVLPRLGWDAWFLDVSRLLVGLG